MLNDVANMPYQCSKNTLPTVYTNTMQLAVYALLKYQNCKIKFLLNGLFYFAVLTYTYEFFTVRIN